MGEARTLGRYVLLDEIAAGGMATVHFGRQRGEAGFAKIVAIKRLHAQFARDPDFRAMFLDEAHLASRIRHPNVVSTLDVFQDGDELFLALEYVLGESLSKLLRSMRSEMKGVVPVHIAVGIMVGALEGLHAAHTATSTSGEPLGIVHRDVSPQNILIGSDGIARVLDFGIAKASDRRQATAEGQIKGKVAYMSPEQVRGEPLDCRSDIFSASIVLWETLTCLRLFDADSATGAMTKVLAGNVPLPSRLADVPDALDAIVIRGLAPRREDRYATALEMAEALERAVPPASPREIARWLETTAGSAITERREALKRAEREDSHERPAAEVAVAIDGGDATDRLTATNDTPPTVAAPRRRSAWWLLALGAVFFALFVTWRWQAQPKDSVIAPSLPTSTAPIASVMTPVSSAGPSVIDAPSASASASAPRATTTTLATNRRPPHPSAAPTTSHQPECHYEFAVDATGTKIPIRKCE